jgi:hypothetical protein
MLVHTRDRTSNRSGVRYRALMAIAEMAGDGGVACETLVVKRQNEREYARAQCQGSLAWSLAVGAINKCTS